MQPSEDSQKNTEYSNEPELPVSQTQPSPAQDTEKGKAILPFVLSIISVLGFAFTPVAFVIAVIAFVTGIQRKKRHQSFSEASIVISIIGIVVTLLLMPTFIQAWTENI